MDKHSGQRVWVTLVSANHCPGSAMMVFAFPNGPVHLHTGDFRFHSKFRQDPVLSALAAASANGTGVLRDGFQMSGDLSADEGTRGVDTIFLDTTYCAPQHDFPLQSEAVQFVADMVVANQVCRSR